MRQIVISTFVQFDEMRGMLSADGITRTARVPPTRKRRMRREKRAGPSPAEPRADTGSARAAAAAAQLWRQSGPSAVTFGGVAEASGLAKSLVSHHFATREHLVRETAQLLAAGVREDLTSFAAKLSGVAVELRSASDIAGYAIEHLATGPDRSGIGLLEFAALGLTTTYYNLLFVDLMKQARAVLPTQGWSQSSDYLMAFGLGELLHYCPQRTGPVGLAGLRERLDWFTSASGTGEARWLSEFFATMKGGDHVAFDPRLMASAKPKPDRAPAERPFAIIAAALDILAESDAASITHRQIAERAKVPLAATTYHFVSKADILEAAYRHIIATAVAEAQRLEAERGVWGDGSFHQLIAMMLDFYVSEGGRSTLANFHLALYACRADSMADFAARAHDTEVELLRATAKKQGVMLSRNLAQAISSLIGGILLFRLLGMRETEISMHK